MKYKIKDGQQDGYFSDESLFDNASEILNQLISYHDIDFGGSDDEDNEISIAEYFKFWKINTLEKKLNFILDYGEWEIQDENGEFISVEDLLKLNNNL